MPLCWPPPCSVSFVAPGEFVCSGLDTGPRTFSRCLPVCCLPCSAPVLAFGELVDSDGGGDSMPFSPGCLPRCRPSRIPLVGPAGVTDAAAVGCAPIFSPRLPLPSFPRSAPAARDVVACGSGDADGEPARFCWPLLPLCLPFSPGDVATFGVAETPGDAATLGEAETPGDAEAAGELPA
jgi:hypothetical protein